MKITAPEGMFTLKETAAKTGYTILHLQRLCAAGKVPHVRRGKYYFFSPADVDAIIGRK